MEKVTTISGGNFSNAVKYAHSLNKKMAVNAVSQYIVLPLCSMLFAIHALVLLFGIALAVVAENNASIPLLDKFPFIANYCNWLWGQFSAVTDLDYLKAALAFVLLYLIPVVVCYVIKLILSIFISGQKPEITGTVAQQGKQLYQYVEQGPLPKQFAYDMQVIWSRISGMSIIACFLAVICYAMYTAFTSEDTALWIYIVLGVIAVLEFILIYILYAKMHYLLCALMKPGYSCEKEWESFKKEAERYWLSVDMDEKIKRIKEEEKEKSYDGWKYRNLEKTAYYKEKFDEHYARYMGYPPRTDDDDVTRLVKDVEDDLSGGGWGNY